MRALRTTDWIAAAAFAWLTAVIPWEALQGHPFVDNVVYTEHFLHEESIFRYTDFRGAIDYVINEALWEYLVTTLVHSLGIPIAWVFLAISVGCVFVFGLFVSRRHGWAAVILLLNPLMITFAYDQLRLALAFSLVLIAYMIRSRWIAAALFIPAALIHTSIAVFAGAYFAIRTLVRRVSPAGQHPYALFGLLTLMGLTVSVMIGPWRSAILGYFGDRRALLTGATNSTLAYSSFWVGLLAVLLLQPRRFLSDEVHAFSVFVLSITAANLVTGGYTLRFLSVGLPMIVASMLDVTLSLRLLTVSLYVIYCGFQWMYFAGRTL